MSPHTAPKPYRRCAECKVEQPIASFAPSSTAATGVSGYCRSCRPQVAADTRGCAGKEAHRSSGDAAVKALSYSRSYAKPLRPYLCARCGAWHLTSNAQSARR